MTSNHKLIHEAAEKGYTQVVCKELEKGVDVDARDYVGNTPLMLAVHKRRVDVVQLLVEKGADVNATNMDGDGRFYCLTPLFAVADNADTESEGDAIEIAKILLAAGAQRDVRCIMPINDADLEPKKEDLLRNWGVDRQSVSLTPAQAARWWGEDELAGLIENWPG